MRERLKRLGQGSSVTEGTVAVMGSSRGESGTTSGRESERKGSALVALLTSRRWERWAGVMRVRGFDVEETQRRHDAAVLYLLRKGVTMEEMRRRDLDDPRLTEEERGMLLAEK